MGTLIKDMDPVRTFIDKSFLEAPFKVAQNNSKAVVSETEALDSLLSVLGKEQWTPGNMARLKKIFSEKIRNLDGNVDEIAQSVSLMRMHTKTQGERMLNFIYTYDRYNISAKQYVEANPDLLTSTSTVPAKFMDLFSSDVKKELKKNSFDQDPKNRFLTELLNFVKKELRAVMDIQIKATKPATDFSVLSQLEQQSEISGEFAKTFGWLSTQSTSKKSLYLTYLYIMAKTNPRYNGEAESISNFIKTKQGDCTEHMLLYYLVLKNRGDTPVKTYHITTAAEGLDHIFTTAKIDGQYYVVDGLHYVANPYFSKAIQFFFSNYKDGRINTIDADRFKNNDFEYERVYGTFDNAEVIAPE